MDKKSENKDLEKEIEKLSSLYNQLLNENEELSSYRKKTEESKRKKKEAFNWFNKTFFNVLFGLKLKKSIEQGLNEYSKTKKVSSSTTSNIIASLIKRFTRIEIIGFLVAIITTTFLGYQTYLFKNQNIKIDTQNTLINKQNELINTEIKHSVQQKYLEEANRRSSLVFLFSNIMDAIDAELKNTTTNPERELSSELIARIVGLSRNLKPYRYLSKDTLTRPVSPERSQLFTNLIYSKLGKDTYLKIFEKGDFRYLELKDIWIQDIPFGNINFNHSIFDNVNFEYCSFEYSRFDFVFSDKLQFQDCNLQNFRAIEGYFDNISFNDCIFTDGMELRNSLIERLWIDKSCFDAISLNDSFIRYAEFQNVFSTHFNYSFDEETISEKVIPLIPKPYNLFTKYLNRVEIECKKNSISFTNTFLVHLFYNQNFFENFSSTTNELNFHKLHISTDQELESIPKFVNFHQIKSRKG